MLARRRFDPGGPRKVYWGWSAMPFRRVMREPVSDLALLQREINRLFERLSEFDRDGRRPGVEWTPATDVFDCKGSLVILLEVPGLLPESISVSVREGVLVVSGERRERRPAGVAAFHCMERPVGRFRREIPLDRALDVKNAQAQLEAGLLRVTIPRVKDRRGREAVIPVQRT